MTDTLDAEVQSPHHTKTEEVINLYANADQCVASKQKVNICVDGGVELSSYGDDKYSQGIKQSTI